MNIVEKLFNFATISVTVFILVKAFYKADNDSDRNGFLSSFVRELVIDFTKAFAFFAVLIAIGMVWLTVRPF